MSDFVIETHGLRKVFRHGTHRIVAVDGLDLAVPAGGVHGFLGPNGAGKSTTLSLLLGLTRPTAGEAKIFGQRVPERLPQVIDRVGAVIEEPAFVPTFSGPQEPPAARPHDRGTGRPGGRGHREGQPG